MFKISKKILQVSIVSALLLSMNVSQASCIENLKSGIDYNPINQPTKKVDFINNNQSKPEVIEFFWYGCSHCYHMDNMVNQFATKHAKDIVFKRYPVMFPKWDSGAQLYFTLEQMNLLDKLHTKVFDKIHKDKINIMNDKNSRDKFLSQEGVDITKFDAMYNSFGIKTKMKIAEEITKSYNLQSSPVFVVNNRYTTDPALAKGYEETIKGLDKIVDALNQKNCK